MITVEKMVSIQSYPNSPDFGEPGACGKQIDDRSPVMCHLKLLYKNGNLSQTLVGAIGRGISSDLA